MTPKDFTRAMGAVLRKHRRSMGLNQTAVGDILGATYQQIQKFESGLNALSAYQITKIVSLFGLSVAQFYEEIGVTQIEMPPSEAESDGFLAARYVGRIADPKLRTNLVDFARKLAYTGAA
jgi:transcriptional regulator with XRE-family HTH domain